MKNRLFPAILIASLSASLPARAETQDKAAPPAATTATAPAPAAGPLAKFLGSWKGEVEVQSADGKKTSYPSRNTFAWTLNGKFLRDEVSDVSGAPTSLGMWSFDPQAKTYRSTYFLAPGGEIVNFTYTWDEKTQVLKGSAPLGGGILMEAEDKFTGKDAYVWTIRVKDPAGRELNRMTGRQTRVP